MAKIIDFYVPDKHKLKPTAHLFDSEKNVTVIPVMSKEEEERQYNPIELLQDVTKNVGPQLHEVVVVMTYKDGHMGVIGNCGDLSSVEQTLHRMLYVMMQGFYDNYGEESPPPRTFA